MSLIGFPQLLSRVSNGFKRRPAGITVKVRCGPITEVPNWARRWALIGAAVPFRLMMPRSTKFAHPLDASPTPSATPAPAAATAGSAQTQPG